MSVATLVFDGPGESGKRVVIPERLLGVLRVIATCDEPHTMLTVSVDPWNARELLAYVDAMQEQLTANTHEIRNAREATTDGTEANQVLAAIDTARGMLEERAQELRDSGASGSSTAAYTTERAAVALALARSHVVQMDEAARGATSDRTDVTLLLPDDERAGVWGVLYPSSDPAAYPAGVRASTRYELRLDTAAGAEDRYARAVRAIGAARAAERGGFALVRVERSFELDPRNGTKPADVPVPLAAQVNPDGSRVEFYTGAQPPLAMPEEEKL